MLTDFVLKRVGRSDAYASSFDLESETYVPLPKGDVHKKKELVQDVTLGDLDNANARPQVCAQNDLGGYLVEGTPPLTQACFNRADKTSCL